jgi:hypothetical protein
MHASFPRQPTPSLRAVLFFSSSIATSSPIHPPSFDGWKGFPTHSHPSPLFHRTPTPHASPILISSRRRILPDNLLDLALICRLILLVQIIRVCLRRALGVDFVQQHLNAQQDLFDRDGGLPALFFVQDGQADGAAGVDVGVEEGWDELAYPFSLAPWSSDVRATTVCAADGGGLVGGCGRTFRRLAGILLWEDDFKLEQAAFPDGLVFAGDGAVPFA